MILLFIFFGCILGLTVGQKEIEYDLNYSGANGTDTAKYPLLTRITRTFFYPSGFCILPLNYGITSYTRFNCEQNCLIQPGTPVPTNEIVRVNCDPGYGPPSNTQHDVTYICTVGKWFLNEPECVKLCPALKQEHLNIECSYGLEPVSCYNYMRPGTVAKFRCDEFYQASYTFSNQTTCLPGGTWSERLPKCSPVCGKVNQVNKVDPTLLYANRTRYGEYPWHVAIYTNFTKRYEYICGGSLIAEKFVLTAAHCLLNQNANYAPFTKSSLKVAVGKRKRDYYIQERYQVNSDVVNIKVPEIYFVDGTRYTGDIALLETEVSFVFNHFVLPVCLDRYGVVKFHKDTKCTIAVWDRTEDGTLRNELREVRLPITPTVQCRQMFPDFIQFLTPDKYCVIHQNGSGSELWDNGGGMTFDASGQHYLYGIVSIKKTDSTPFSAFTDVPFYMQWIYNAMKTRQVPVTIDKICENWKRNQVCMNESVILANERIALAKPRLFKYMAFIGRPGTADPSNPWIQCVGALISDRWVLTADCIRIVGETIVDRPELVILGDLDLYSTMDDARPQIKKIIDIVLHPDYNLNQQAPSSSSTKPPHLALLKLDSPIVIDEYVAPACLHTSDQIPVEKVVLTGRGFVTFNNALSVRMLVAGSSVNNISEGIPPINQGNTLADNSAQLNVFMGTLMGAPMTFTLDGGCTWTLTGIAIDPTPCDQRDITTCTVRPISAVKHVKLLDYLQWIKSVVWPDK